MSAATRIIAGVLVILAVALGILAFFVGRRPPPVSTAPGAPLVVTFPVVIAARPLDAGVPIPADAVRIEQMPVQPVGAYIRTEDVVGHVPRIAVTSGMPLTEGGLNQGLPLSLKQGERGVAIPVDEVVGVGNAIQAGDYVDVFFSMRAADGVAQSTERTLARLLLARIRVLAYGADSLMPVTVGATRDRSPRTQARSAVLAVPVQDVDALILASQAGKLTLALRFPQDTHAPDPGLFAAPRRVLTARTGLAADEKERVESAENRAYAGLDSPGLAGGDGNAPTVMAALPSGGAGMGVRPLRGVASRQYIEVIRGSDVTRELPGGGAAAEGRTP